LTASDRRSFRIALVADRYVNPPHGGFDALVAFATAGWGVMQLPSDDYPLEVAAPMLVQVAEQAEEFHRHGYDVVLVGQRAGLREALAALGMKLPAQVRPRSSDQLLAFLESRPVPLAARQEPSGS
jgi:hypothetical protein